MRDATGAVQSAVVFGGTSEIALATVERLAQDRLTRATLAARDTTRAEAEADRLRSAGLAIEVTPFDADDPGSHAAAVAEAFAKTGDVDVVLVAFGVLGPGPDAQLDAALDVLQTNLTGAVSVASCACELLRGQGHGTLVVLSSVAAERPRASNFAYGASKAGLDAFAQGLGDSLRGSGVDVLVVRPGFVRTRMTEGLKEAPLAIGPEAVAEAIAVGIRTRAHTVWAPPPMRWVMLALRVLPRGIFRRLPI